MALSFATYCGFFLMKSVIISQKVGMVCTYSSIVSVKPSTMTTEFHETPTLSPNTYCKFYCALA